MNAPNPSYRCVSCSRTETAVPLVSLRYAGQPNWICSACLPTLIHHPERLADKLTGTESFNPDGPPRH